MGTVIQSIFIPFFFLSISYFFTVGSEEFLVYKDIARLFYISVFLLYFLVNRKQINWNSYVLYFLTIILLALVYAVNGSPIVINLIVVTFFTIYLKSRNVSQESLLLSLYFAYLAALTLFLTYVLLSGNLFASVTIGDRERYYFGFVNPNKLGITCYTLIVMTVMLQWHHLLEKKTVILMLCSLFTLVILSDSRTAILCSVIFVYLVYSKLLRRSIAVGALLPVLFLVLSISLSHAYGGKLDAFVSNRLSQYYYLISQMTVEDYIFGRSIQGIAVDNSYLQLYFGLGLILYLMLSVYVFLKYLCINIYINQVFVFSTLIYGLFEGVLVRPELLIAVIFYYVLSYSDARKALSWIKI